MAGFQVREEAPADYDAIRDLNRQAFNGDAEAELVDRLRTSGAVIVSAATRSCWHSPSAP
ncbi:hypothetical protein SBA6_450004 [Candidatus Sulfopaludibacter sp. SbA6]|nr:hypothetical protein SBA6_450004 [Candidatus Sulfopaludibacter sp. SbA6]